MHAACRDLSTDLQCLESGRFVVSLLSALLTAQDQRVSVPPELQEAVLNLVARICCSSRNSPCKAVTRLSELRSQELDSATDAQGLKGIRGKDQLHHGTVQKLVCSWCHL